MALSARPPDALDPAYPAWARARRDELAAAVAIMPGSYRRKARLGQLFVAMLARFDAYLDLIAAQEAAKDGGHDS